MNRLSIFAAYLAAALMFLAASPVAADSNQALSDGLSGLVTKSFSKKAVAVEAVAHVDHPRTAKILDAMLNGALYYRKSDERVVIAEEIDDGYAITDAVTHASLGEVSKREIKKISVNNKLRRQLRSAIARLTLFSEEPAVRLGAVQDLTKSIDDEAVELLQQRLPEEMNNKVRAAINVALALVALDSDDRQVRLEAVAVLGDSLNTEARAKLSAMMQKTASGEYAEPDRAVRKAAEKALASIDSRLQFYQGVETVFFGLSLGSVLLLAAIGLAITFGVMGVINMAHGELIMLGAYTTFVVQQLMPNYIDYSLFVAIPAAFLVAGLTGIAIERGVIRFLYGRPLETLLATFGISLILQQAVRTIFSPLNRSVETPSWMSGSWEINAVLSLTYNRLYIIIFALLVFVALLLILKKTPLGLQVRAVAQNRAMARAMGVRSGWVDAMTFGLGSGIAGVAGVALSQLTNVGPNLGQAYIIDSFMVVVFGGVGNLWGTLVGAMSLGLVNKLLEPWSGAVLAKILVLVAIILFIQKRPRGLFPQRGRAAEH